MADSDKMTLQERGKYLRKMQKRYRKADKDAIGKLVDELQAVGVTRVLAMLVTPASAAYLLSRRLPMMMLSAAIMGCLAAILGLYSSYYVNVASGPAIVLVETALFALAFLAAPKRGVFWSWLHSRRAEAN